MSPQAALRSEVFLVYVALVVGVAIVAWIAIALLGRIAGRDVSHAARSHRAWLIMAPATLAAIFLGRVPTIVFIFGLAMLGFWEYARATGLARDRVLASVVMATIAALGVDVILADRLPPQLDWLNTYLALPALATALIVGVPIARNRTADELARMTLAVFGFLYVGWMFGHLALLANGANAYGHLLFLLFAVELSDVAAYVCGRVLGRHPLRSNVSPRKTWEGALGGLLVALALPWLLRFSFPHFGAPELVLTGLIVGIGGQLGDLVMSLVKRETGVKDMGSLLPGHGGILDRIDSLVLVAPLFVHMVRARDALFTASSVG